MLLGVAISRRLAAVCAALVAFMVVTMAVNAPSFASGLEILLQNGQAGVYQVSGPISNKNVTSTQVQNPSQDQQISLLGAQQRLHFPIYWPQDLPNGYTQSQIYLYTQNSQLQSDGPVLEFQFTHAGASGSHAQLAIREFKPKGDVLQVVEAGSARPLETDQNGRAKSIYIDGQWVTINYAHHWLHNGHCELMLQRDGVVFLIAGDQREHVGLDDLLSIANSLQPLQVNRLMRSDATMEYVTQVNHDMPGPFDGDIFLFSSDNGTGGPYLRLIGTDQPPEQ